MEKVDFLLDFFVSFQILIIIHVKTLFGRQKNLMVGLQTKSLPTDGKYFMLWVNEPDNMNWLGEELFGNKVLFFPAFRPKHEQGKEAEAVQVLYNVHIPVITLGQGGEGGGST